VDLRLRGPNPHDLARSPAFPRRAPGVTGLDAARATPRTGRKQCNLALDVQIRRLNPVSPAQFLLSENLQPERRRGPWTPPALRPARVSVSAPAVATQRPSYGGPPRPARQQVLQGRDAPYRPRRAWTARAGSNPMPDNADWSIFWATISACGSRVEPFSRYHRRAWVTSSTRLQTWTGRPRQRPATTT
jgi:hypothetical protein